MASPSPAITGQAEPRDRAAAAFAADALTLDTVDLVPIRRGANARVWRVDDPTGRPRALLKRYPAAGPESRDRLASEVGALRFLAARGEDRVPRLLGADPAARLALLSFIPGTPGPADAPVHEDMEAAIAFIERLHRSRRSDDADRLPMAAEACLSWPEILRQVDARHAKLSAVAADRPALADLLERLAARRAELAPLAETRLGRGDELAHPLRTLSPSDFGFHNAVRDEAGDLVFVDFEYFGWDDPAKLAADTELHPAMRLPASLVDLWHERLAALYGAKDAGYSARVAVYRPLLALRWTCILLNEFLPERWRHRQAAGVTDRLDDVLQIQLDKAEIMLNQATLTVRETP